EQPVLSRIGSSVAFKDNRLGRFCMPLASQFGDLLQSFFTFSIGEPHDLKRMIAFEEAVGVVVNRFAGAAEEARGCVVFAQNQMSVGFAALQGNTNGHLPKRAAGERVSAGECL